MAKDSFTHSFFLPLWGIVKKGFQKMATHYIGKFHCWRLTTKNFDHCFQSSFHFIRMESNGFDFVCFWQISKSKKMYFPWAKYRKSLSTSNYDENSRFEIILFEIFKSWRNHSQSGANEKNYLVLTHHVLYIRDYHRIAFLIPIRYTHKKYKVDLFSWC